MLSPSGHPERGRASHPERREGSLSRQGRSTAVDGQRSSRCASLAQDDTQGCPNAYLHRMAKRTQRREWWQSYFDGQYLLEYEPLFSLERDRQEVARLLDVLGLPSGARMLDVPCGQGRHAHLLAEAGFDVDGLDYSRSFSSARGSAAPGRGSAIREATCARFRRAGPGASARSSTSSRRSDSSPIRPTIDASSRSSRACSSREECSFGTAGIATASWRAFSARDWWQTNDGTLIATRANFRSAVGEAHGLHGVVGPERRRQSRSIAFASTRRRDSPSSAPMSG